MNTAARETDGYPGGYFWQFRSSSSVSRNPRKGAVMKAMGTIVCALGLAAAACVDGPHYDDTSLALTGSGSGSGSSTNGGSVWHSTWNGRAASLAAWTIGADGYQRS